ncbi:MAG: tetratricopeptide repeat protein [Sulfuricellaceae bacterium]|nr:tetratricopeptide repeat protein [Sulfuricellaceae bacterium]
MPGGPAPSTLPSKPPAIARKAPLPAATKPKQDGAPAQAQTLASAAGTPGSRTEALKVPEPAAEAKHGEAPKEAQAEKSNAKPRLAATLTEAVSAPPPRPAKNLASRKPAKTPEGEVMKEISASQRAVFDYQQALAFIQDGRMTEALDSLERSLAADPNHKPARQLLASMYMQSKQWRQAEALLRDGLKLDAAQPSLAMTLARIQVELGNNAAALATLKSSLSYASDQADYLAFLATMYQRLGQHPAAIRYFQQALELAPGHGPWLMGLGISLQADKHTNEARRSFARALEAGGLSPATKSYIESWLQLHHPAD